MSEAQYYLDDINRLFYNSSTLRPIKLTFNLNWDEEIKVQKQFTSKKLSEITINDLEVWETYTSPLIWMNEKAIAYYIPHYLKLMIKNRDNLSMTECVIQLLESLLDENGYSYTDRHDIYNEFNRDQKEFIIQILQYISSDDYHENECSDWETTNSISRIKKHAKSVTRLWESMSGN